MTRACAKQLAACWTWFVQEELLEKVMCVSVVQRPICRHVSVVALYNMMKHGSTLRLKPFLVLERSVKQIQKTLPPKGSCC